MNPNLPKVVHLFGAGASKPLGKPLTSEIFDGEWDKFSQKDLFLEIAEKIGTDPRKIDVEEVLKITDLAELINTAKPEGSFLIPLFSDMGKQKLQCLIELGKEVKNLIYDKYSTVDSGKCVNTLSTCFGNFDPRHTSCLTVFTTNYDRAIEHFFKGSRISFQPPAKLLDGFIDDPDGGKIWSEKGYYSPPNEKDKYWYIPFFKLHGSVGWVEINGQIHEYNPHAFPNVEKPVIIYPAYKSIPDKQIFDFAQEQLLNSLLKADLCNVFGFSFRDAYITRIFKKALFRNLTLIVKLYLPNNIYKPDSAIPELIRIFGDRVKNTMNPLGEPSSDGNFYAPVIPDEITTKKKQ